MENSPFTFEKKRESLLKKAGSKESNVSGFSLLESVASDGHSLGSGHGGKKCIKIASSSSSVSHGITVPRRSSVKVAVFELAPLEEKASATERRRRSRRISHFSQDPRRRSSSLQKQEASDESGKAFFEPLQLIKSFDTTETSKNMLYHTIKHHDAKKAHEQMVAKCQNRKPVTVHTVTLPRRGLIKLTGLPYEFDNPGHYDDRKSQPAPRKYWEHTKFTYGRRGSCESDASSDFAFR